jgi:hypothetical protein
VTRHSASDVPLRLDGEDLTLVSLHINDQPWTDYKEENNQLVIDNLPEHLRCASSMKSARRRTPRWKGFISQAKRCVPSAKRKVSATLPGIWTARTCWRASPPKSSPIKPNIRSCSPTATAWRRRAGEWPSLGTVAGSVPETVLPVCAGGR